MRSKGDRVSSTAFRRRRGMQPPPSYVEFVSDSRRFVEAAGVNWAMKLAETGLALPGQAWDLRSLTRSHARNAVWLDGFLLNPAAQAAARERGWNRAALPKAATLSDSVQEFIKALVAHRCESQMAERGTRDYAKTWMKFFSLTLKAPWEIASEDVNRFIDLEGDEGQAGKHMLPLVRAMNQHLLSVNCPIRVDGAKEITQEMLKGLTHRAGEQKLPEMRPLYELARIVFQEEPQGHNDLIRFAILRLLILTGLRIMEVMMLPLDCLRWQKNIDVVTGKAAGEVGGVTTSLQLRYFAEKRSDARPDLLVEDVQWIPQHFQQAVADAVNMARDATARLRRVLEKQHRDPRAYPESDLRRFKTDAGNELTTGDLLFLVIYRNRDEVPSVIPADAKIAPPHVAGLTGAIGAAGPVPTTLFQKYSSTPGARQMRVRPHSLRHLMNTELFRLGVPDTVITQQFGRRTVAQSYEYDHRSLAEHLRFVQLPDAATAALEPGSTQELVARMVVSGVAEGSHLAKSFKAIQAAHGDQIAFKYLAANSDGFHVTPYGFCTNSFSLNPCARHLKCFDQCKQFTASGLPRHRTTLEQLKASLEKMRAAAARKPANSIGRRNQIAHAERLLAGVTAALEAQPNAAVFPHGQDHSATGKDLFT